MKKLMQLSFVIMILVTLVNCAKQKTSEDSKKTNLNKTDKKDEKKPTIPEFIEIKEDDTKKDSKAPATKPTAEQKNTESNDKSAKNNTQNDHSAPTSSVTSSQTSAPSPSETTTNQHSEENKDLNIAEKKIALDCIKQNAQEFLQVINETGVVLNSTTQLNEISKASHLICSQESPDYKILPEDVDAIISEIAKAIFPNSTQVIST